nr:LysR substrate-binding domain-containing protein [Paracoccus sphaerophysae]
MLPRRPTPIRATLDAFMAGHPPRSIIETSSVITMREILRQSDHLGALSRQQAQTPAEAHALTILPVEVPNSRRPIGLTTRSLWEPTALQREFLAILHEVARKVA